MTNAPIKIRAFISRIKNKTFYFENNQGEEEREREKKKLVSKTKRVPELTFQKKMSANAAFRMRMIIKKE